MELSRSNWNVGTFLPSGVPGGGGLGVSNPPPPQMPRAPQKRAKPHPIGKKGKIPGI